MKGLYQAVLHALLWGICFSLCVTSECFDEARKRDCAQVYSMSEIKQCSSNLLGLCKISLTLMQAASARTLTQQEVQMKL